MSAAVRPDRRSGSVLREVVRTVGGVWRRLVPRDGADGAAPIVLPPRASILVLQLQQVGDTLMMSPVLRAVRQRYPDASIDLLTTPVCYDINRRSPYVRTQHVVETTGAGPWRRLRRIGAWWRTIRAIRRARYDCVLACRNHVSINYVLAAVATGARHLVGFNEAAGGFLFTRRLRVAGRESVRETNLALASAIDADPAQGREEFWFAPQDTAFVDALLDRRGVPPDARLAVIHPASNWQSKTWYPERWAAVADWLATEEGFHPVFVGRARDAEVIDAVQGMMTEDSWSLAGDTDLCQLGAL